MEEWCNYSRPSATRKKMWLSWGREVVHMSECMLFMLRLLVCKPKLGKPMLDQLGIVKGANIGTMLANHHHTSIGPTFVQHQISLVGQWWPNFGKPMLDQQSFVQWVNIGTVLANCHHWNYKGPQHQLSLMGQCQSNSGVMYNVSM